MIEFTDRELKALHVPEHSFASFLASLSGYVLIGYQYVKARETYADEPDGVAYFV